MEASVLTAHVFFSSLNPMTAVTSRRAKMRPIALGYLSFSATPSTQIIAPAAINPYSPLSAALRESMAPSFWLLSQLLEV